MLDVFVHNNVDPPPSPSPAPFFFKKLDWRYKRRCTLTLFNCLESLPHSHYSRKCFTPPMAPTLRIPCHDVLH